MRAMQETYDALTALGIPGRFEAYPVGKAPAPPFFVYTVDGHGEFYADDGTFARLPRIHVELLEKVSDPALEQSVRDALEAEFGPVEQTGTWSQSEQCHIEQYDFTYTKEE
jgi:hypothetical protein